MHRRPRLLDPVLLLCAALALIVVVPRPASASLLPEFRTVVTGISPRIDGVTAKSAPNGESITVTNTSDQPLYVYGYQREQYLKITKDGVWQNQLSPATYLNKEQTIGVLPRLANPDKPPKWVKLESGSTVTWHDHRIHWMGSQDPLPAQNDPHHSHVLNHWKIPIQHAGKRGSIEGTLTWYPGVRWGLDAAYAGIGLVVVATFVTVLVIGRRRRRTAKAPVS